MEIPWMDLPVHIVTDPTGEGQTGEGKSDCRPLTGDGSF